jgi:hypothetical protein
MTDDVINSLVISSVHVGAVRMCTPASFKHVIARLGGVPFDFVISLGAKVSRYETSLKGVAILKSTTQTLRT